jgi:hypothetical protein
VFPLWSCGGVLPLGSCGGEVEVETEVELGLG